MALHPGQHNQPADFDHHDSDTHPFYGYYGSPLHWFAQNVPLMAC
ncbi:hypothetical protein ymoll0001_23130 [Yersinia mollaretii ATCC 43969]|uniref:Uncharacterized protein n=1 Tax=Yersinia mollaretii (strain ATCC 43969 / DSM 18520 / CIP 103324 / CNY 7263 / WAIP 204) TaxID=349967 RepID=A0ABP2EHR4_YERMW|nr:hypothetical protein ymoll0001_23130 [Yersinia mollaretii ATCC 43969]